MRKRIFKYRAVYYLALITSLLLFLISAFSFFAIFENFNIFKLIVICGSIFINLAAFINLAEKYDKAILFLNLSLGITIILMGYYALFLFLNNYFKFMFILLLVLLIVNIFKIKRVNDLEIEEIGKHKE